MKFQAYPAYKESGVEWLGVVPEHWQIKRLGHISAQEKNAFVDGPFGSDLKTADYKDEGIPLIQLNNIKEGEHILKNMKFITELKKEQLSRHIAKFGDVVIAKMAEPVARATLVNNDYEEYVIVADCVKMTPDNSKIHSQFLIYSLNSKNVRTGAELASGGTTRIRINLTELKKLWIPYPSIQEQTAIADFLDRETSRIDELSKEKERFIELLKEKRQALISHAVTKGLNPTVKMKNSCVDWLGEVPEHWILLKIRRISSLQQGLQIAQDKRFHEEGVNRMEYITIKSINSKNFYNIREYIESPSKNVICDIDDVLMARTGATGEVITDVKGVFHNNFFKINYNNKKISKPFLVYFFKMNQVKSHLLLVAGTTTIPDLNHDGFLDVKIALPPLLEQTEIANYLDQQTQKIDALITETQHSINLLKEHRAALISAAVTGKIDIRELYRSNAPALER